MFKLFDNFWGRLVVMIWLISSFCIVKFFEPNASIAHLCLFSLVLAFAPWSVTAFFVELLPDFKRLGQLSLIEYLGEYRSGRLWYEVVVFVSWFVMPLILGYTCLLSYFVFGWEVSFLQTVLLGYYFFFMSVKVLLWVSFFVVGKKKSVV